MICPHCANKNLIKAGLRNTTRQGVIQKYYCKNCKKYCSDKPQPHTHYPIQVILYGLQLYNKGYPLSKVKTLLGKKYRYSPPERTMYSWIARYRPLLSFLPLRKRFNLHPDDLTTTLRFHHQQVYPFSYHHLKLNIANKHLPQLKRYINWMTRNLSDKIFLQGPRASQESICQQNNPVSVVEKKHDSSSLAALALHLKHKQQSAHEAVESFFLFNDAYTVCMELPVFLNPKETTLFDITSPLTGHIDLIQIRNNKLYIMDYKPNLNHPEKYAGQLLAYKQAIHHRTQIPKDHIITAVFNEYAYYELV
jgi:transposase-like protein